MMTAKPDKVSALLSHYANVKEKSAECGKNGLYLSNVAKAKLGNDIVGITAMMRKIKSPGYNKLPSSNLGSPSQSQSTLATFGMSSSDESFLNGPDEEVFDSSCIGWKRIGCNQDQKRHFRSDVNLIAQTEMLHTQVSELDDQPKEHRKGQRKSISNYRGSFEASSYSSKNGEINQLSSRSSHSSPKEKGLDEHNSERSRKVSNRRRSSLGTRRNSIGENLESPISFSKGSTHSHESYHSNSGETTPKKSRDKKGRRGSSTGGNTGLSDGKSGSPDGNYRERRKSSIDCSSHSFDTKGSANSDDNNYSKSSQHRSRRNHERERHEEGSKQHPEDDDSHKRSNKRGSITGGVQRSKSNDMLNSNVTNRVLTRSKSLPEEHENTNLRRARRRASTEMANNVVRSENLKRVPSEPAIDSCWDSHTFDPDDVNDEDMFNPKLKSSKSTTNRKASKLDFIGNSDMNASGLVHYDYSDDESFVDKSRPRQIPTKGGLGKIEDDESSDDDKEIFDGNFFHLDNNGSEQKTHAPKSRRSSLDSSAANVIRPSYRKAKLDQMQRRKSQTSGS